MIMIEKKITILFLFTAIHTSTFAYKIADFEKFKLQSDCQKCDLTEVSRSGDISNLNYEGSYFTRSELSVNASHANFSKTNFIYSHGYDSDFRNTNFNSANLSYSYFAKSSFDNSDFTGANLTFGNFSYGHFVNVNFTNAKLKNANFEHANLYNSNISSQQLQSLKSYKCAILPDGDQFDDDGKINCGSNYITNLNTSNKNIEKVEINQSTRGVKSDLAHFRETKECTNCDLSNYELCYYGENFSNSNIESSDLHKASAHYCKMSKSNFINSLINSSNFSDAELMKVNFLNSQLNYSSFSGSHLSEASFTNSNLKNVNFTRANLSSTDFTTSNTKGIDFTRAILIGSNITQDQLNVAENLSCSVLPNGEIVEPKNGNCS